MTQESNAASPKSSLLLFGFYCLLVPFQENLFTMSSAWYKRSTKNEPPIREIRGPFFRCCCVPHHISKHSTFQGPTPHDHTRLPTGSTTILHFTHKAHKDEHTSLCPCPKQPPSNHQTSISYPPSACHYICIHSSPSSSPFLCFTISQPRLGFRTTTSPQAACRLNSCPCRMTEAGERTD